MSSVNNRGEALESIGDSLLKISMDMQLEAVRLEGQIEDATLMLESGISEISDDDVPYIVDVLTQNPRRIEILQESVDGIQSIARNAFASAVFVTEQGIDSSLIP